MKKMTLTVMAIACLSCASMALADTTDSDIKASNNQYVFQTISTNVDYTETGNGLLGTPTGILDTEKGSVPGYALSISIMQDWWSVNNYLEAEYDHSSGDTNYVGGLAGPPATPYGSVVGTSGATLENYRFRYGKGYAANDEFMLTPYLELGGHKWVRIIGLHETYRHNYYGIGSLVQYSPSDKLVLSANAMFGRTFDSYIDVRQVFLTPQGWWGDSLVYSGALGNSILYKAGFSADYGISQHVHVNIGVDYMSFKYGISAAKVTPYGTMWEPDSKTNYTTVRVGLGYAF